MLRNLFCCYLLVLVTNSAFASAENKITFESSDELLISADTYFAHPVKTTPLILLFHQAGSSRGEYREIAPRLNKLGFNCIAVDQRSGESSMGIDNETAMRAAILKLATNYVDAQPDILTAIKHVNKQYNQKPIIWGSSYSASLVITTAAEHPELIKGVIAFSPGEYFSKFGKSKKWVAESAELIKAPVFITSSKTEVFKWKPIYDAIPTSSKTSFIPENYGAHGSKALWKKFEDSEAYWKAVTKFLEQFKK